MTRLAFTTVRGMAPGVSDKALEQNQATEARNCRLDMGDIRPWALPTVEHDPDKWSAAPAIATIYKYTPGGAVYWIHWPNDVSVALGPVADDANERIYYTVDDDASVPPRVTNSSLVVAPPENTRLTTTRSASRLQGRLLRCRSTAARDRVATPLTKSPRPTSTPM